MRRLLTGQPIKMKDSFNRQRVVCKSEEWEVNLLSDIKKRGEKKGKKGKTKRRNFLTRFGAFDSHKSINE